MNSNQMTDKEVWHLWKESEKRASSAELKLKRIETELRSYTLHSLYCEAYNYDPTHKIDVKTNMAYVGNTMSSDWYMKLKDINQILIYLDKEQICPPKNLETNKYKEV